VTPFPIIHGAIIPCRPVGMLSMSDEGGGDAKIIAVPTDKLTPLYHEVLTYEDLPKITLEQIKHFFELYKALEPGKWVKINGWEGVEAAHAEIMNGIKAYQNKSSGK
ncbi:MAG: inorganic diphosphatase, partial [Gallionella sp.]|nr:inorganic diphosphatase [Gallionella sp.]